jgi:transposase-like protein
VRGSGHSRNGKSVKTIQTETGFLAIEVPRDRNGAFEPQLVAKRQLEGFDDKILALCMRRVYPLALFRAIWKSCTGWMCRPR